jgi:hypothetical protein
MRFYIPEDCIFFGFATIFPLQPYRHIKQQWI